MSFRLGSYLVCLAALILVGCEGKQPETTQQPPVTTPPVSSPASDSVQPAPISPADFVMQGVSVGQAIPDVERKLGKPSSSDYVQGIGAQVNFYESQGLDVYFNRQSGTVTGWRVSKPSLPTARHVEVGATRDDVVRAYGSGFTAASTTSRLSYALPGHPDESINFDFLDGKVIRIFIRVL